jgi:phosphinothricin acetyltransferase
LKEDRKIRLAKKYDLPAIVDIYNQAIRLGFATGHTKEFSVEQRRMWFDGFNPDNYPIYMLEVGHQAIGYGTLSPWRPGRQAMQAIAEVSFFLGERFMGAGHGSWLLGKLIEEAKQLGFMALIAILIEDNKASIRLLKKFEFEKWGHFPNLVQLKEHMSGQLIFGRRLTSSDNMQDGKH